MKFPFPYLLLMVGAFLIYLSINPLQAKLRTWNQPANASDTHSEINLEFNEDYRDLKTRENGEVKINLGSAISSSSEGKSFNRGARFRIGCNNNPVFTVNNELDANIKVMLKNQETSGSPIILHSHNGHTLQPGESANFYFEINTRVQRINNKDSFTVLLEVKKTGGAF